MAELAPKGIVTEAGTVATVDDDVSVTFTPVEAAFPLRVIVPVLEPPPPTVIGERVKPLNVAALIVSGADTFVPAADPTTIATAFAETPVVLHVKVADVD